MRTTKISVNYFKQMGFTLLELLVALTLLAFVSFFTAQSLKTTVTSSRKIQGDIDVNSEVKSAVSLIKADISRAFNNRDLYISVYNEAQREHIRRWQEAQKNPTQTQPTTPQGQTPGTQPTAGAGTTPQPGQPQLPTGPPPEYKPRVERVLTQFIGGKDNLEFTSLNGNSIRKGAYTSELAEIGYTLKSCKRRGKGQKSTECLWRRLSYYLDGDIPEGGQDSVLIEDVTLFELKYLRKKNEDEVEWRDTWTIDDVNTQNQLPLAVQMTIEVSKPSDKSADEFKKKRTTAYIPIDFVNNDNIKNIIQMNLQGNPMDPANAGSIDNSTQDPNAGYESGTSFDGDGS